MKSRLWTILVLAAAVAVAGCASNSSTGDNGVQRIAIEVTQKGFEPAVVNARAGEPVTLVVTRKTDRTCAKEFVMAEKDIRRDLPLNQAVEITFTPDKPGDLRYACAMDMIAGTVHVE